MHQGKSAALTIALARIPARARAVRPPETKWPARKTLLFIMLASTLGWMTILIPLLYGG